MIKPLAVMLSLLWALPVLADAKAHEYFLENGMKVIVKPDNRAPVAVSQVWYKVGASYETDGITGISHALEHMMFKGTKKHGPGEFSKIISALGGSENAFTSRDYTAYYETLAVRHLDKALELEADRMQNLLLDADEFEKEIEVVKEERRLRTEDKPIGQVYEQFNAVSWRSSPYRIPVIGWMNDLEHMTVDDLSAWYKRWYAPNNATLVVVGDVEPNHVVQLAKKHFGPISPVKVEAVKPPLEPKQRGLTRVEIEFPARQPFVIMGYKTPIVGTAEYSWEPYALYVLASVLDGGDSARLASKLVREQGIAASAGAEYGTYSRLSGQFLFSGTPTDAHTTQEVEKALRKQVEELQEELVKPEELQRVVRQLVASKVYEADSMFYQAMQIGVLETVGLDWRLLEQELEQIKAVTAEQVRAVARKYLIDENLTIATLKPLSMDSKNLDKLGAVGGGYRAH